MDHLSFHSVLLHVRGTDSRHSKHRHRRFYLQDNGLLSYTSSGIFLGRMPPDQGGHGVVLATASVLAPFFETADPSQPMKRSCENGYRGSQGGETPVAAMSAATTVLHETLVSVRFETAAAKKSAWCPAFFQGRIVLPELQSSIQHLFGTSHPALRYAGGAAAPGHLAVFFVDLSGLSEHGADFQPWLQCHGCNCFASKQHGPSDFPCKAAQTTLQSCASAVDQSTFYRGQHLWIMSSGYGLTCPRVLQNSLSTGVTCNVLPGLALTDARCLAGAEGAPVFSCAGQVIGMVIDSPFDFTPSMDEDELPHSSDVVEQLPHAHALRCSAGKTRRSKLAQRVLSALSTDAEGSSQSNPRASPPPGASFGLVALLDAVFDGRALVLLSSSEGALAFQVFLSLLTQRTQSSIAPRLANAGCYEMGCLSQHQSTPKSVLPLVNVWPIGPAVMAAASRSVVLIFVERSWGSGVVIDSAGHIVTCAHLLRDAIPTSWSGSKAPGAASGDVMRHDTPFMRAAVPWTVRVRMDSRNLISKTSGRKVASGGSASTGSVSPVWLNARVVWVSSSAVDLAILRLDFDSRAMSAATISGASRTQNGGGSACVVSPRCKIRQPARLRPRTEPMVDGEPIAVVGHGGFGPTKSLDVSVSRGCLAKVVPLSFQNSSRGPALIQTTALVLPGNSGGALFDARGRFCGIVTSNACGNTPDPALEYLNFVLPCSFFDAALSYLSTRETKASEFGDDAYRNEDAEDLSLVHILESTVGSGHSMWESLSANVRDPNSESQDRLLDEFDALWKLNLMEFPPQHPAEAEDQGFADSAARRSKLDGLLATLKQFRGQSATAEVATTRARL